MKKNEPRRPRWKQNNTDPSAAHTAAHSSAIYWKLSIQSDGPRIHIRLKALIAINETLETLDRKKLDNRGRSVALSVATYPFCCHNTDQLLLARAFDLLLSFFLWHDCPTICETTFARLQFLFVPCFVDQHVELECEREIIFGWIDWIGFSLLLSQIIR